MITLNKVTFSYTPGGRNVLAGVDVEFAEGVVHGLLGRNGSGKSTMLNVICGLLSPKAGKVDVDGGDPAKRKPSQMERLFIVPEEFDLPAISLECFARLTAPFYPNFSLEDFHYNCREFEVKVEQKLDSMSMGERKKAYISFAMACHTPHLLMDEPTNGLDIPSKATFRRLMAAHADAGHTIIISTHQVADLERLIENVVIVDDKGIALNASTRKIEERLRFGTVEHDDEVLYSEQSVYGNLGVCVNRNGEETTTNLGLLFGAVLKNRDRVSEIMNR